MEPSPDSEPHAHAIECSNLSLPQLSRPPQLEQTQARPHRLELPYLTEARAKFCIFDGLSSHPELLLEFARQLEVEDLISLYAISRQFHAQVNANLTTTILSQSLKKAPESSRTFLFKGYKNLCMVDPARRAHPVRQQELRLVPTFRWLRMVLYREKVVEEILSLLAVEGHHLPPRATLTLKRIWLVMDIPMNSRRAGLLRNYRHWTNHDLFLATLFFMKLDMRFMDPIDGVGETSLRKLLIGQRSLTTLWRTLKREILNSQIELIQMRTRYSYQAPPLIRDLRVFGISANDVGRDMYEAGNPANPKLIRPDQLVMQECIRRQLKLEKRYLQMILYGHIDLVTFKDTTPTDEALAMAQRDQETRNSSQLPPTDQSMDETQAVATDHKDFESVSGESTTSTEISSTASYDSPPCMEQSGTSGD